MQTKRSEDSIADRAPHLFIPDDIPVLHRHSYRSIWISDLHLGTRACKADVLLSFLRSHSAERLYLVGDVVDGWNRGAFWYWDRAQEMVVRELAEWRRRGTDVVLLPGNHDETNLDLVEGLFGSIAVRSELVHSTAEGRRMLVLHGHQFDGSLSSARWLSRFGGRAYTLALRIADWSTRERFRLDDPSLGTSLKRRLTKVVTYVMATSVDENALLRTLKKNRADGLICGHTHSVEQRLIGPIWYLNDGDWIHNCTALVERYDGGLKLVKWQPDLAGARAARHIALEVG